MTHILTRRAALAGGISIFGAPALPADAPDPVVLIYKEWLAARREWHELSYLPGNEDFDDPRSIDAEKREMSAEVAFIETPPTTLEGIGALAAFLWAEVRPQTACREEFEFRVNAFDCQAVLAIWRACTGREGYPDV